MSNKSGTTLDEVMLDVFHFDENDEMSGNIDAACFKHGVSVEWFQEQLKARLEKN